MNTEINAILASVVAMALLLFLALVNSVSGLRWLAGLAEYRAFVLENMRAESVRWREIAETRRLDRMREFEVRPLDQVEGGGQ